MQPQLKIIRTLDELTSLHEYLQDKTYVAYDCETTGLSKTDEVIGFSICAEVDLAFYIVLAEWCFDKLVYNPLYDASVSLLTILTGKQLIMHNAVFDCMMAESYFKVKLMPSVHTDTMILAHLLNENRRVGLKELAAEIFGEDSRSEQVEMQASAAKNGAKLTKDCYEMYKADSEVLGKYGAKDALLTYKLFLEFVPELFKQKLDKFFYEDESMPLLRGPTYDLNITGLQVDLTELTSLKKQLQAECAEAKAFVLQEVNHVVKEKYPGGNNQFNIGSSQQLAWLLFGELNLEFGTLTKGGKNICQTLGLRVPYTRGAKTHFIAECLRRSGEVCVTAVKHSSHQVKAKTIKLPWAYIACDKEILTKLAPKYEWIKRLLEYQRKTKILNTYVKGIEKRVKYGVIQPSFLQHGTTSGRYSSRNPNFQNLPRDDKRVKKFITARAGNTFVGADYSQLEPRVFAYFSQDERLLASFRGTDDFYSVIGMEVYGKTDCVPRKEGSPDAFGVKYKSLRNLSKVIALASTYGATAHKLAKTTGKSIEDTQADIDRYFEQFPGVAKMMLDSHDQAKSIGQVTNLFGRPRRIPEAKSIPKGIQHADLPYAARNVLNLAVNHRIQSTGASIINRAAIQFHKKCLESDIKCHLVVQVHDSLVVECAAADAETVSVLLQDSMENAVQLPGIKLEAIPKIGLTLSDV